MTEALRSSLSIACVLAVGGCGAAKQIRTDIDLSDPADQPPAMGRDIAHFQVIDGPLFRDGRPLPGDVVQTHAGDCYFLAALAQLAGDHPEIIESAIQDRGDGTFIVRFFDAPVKGRRTPEERRVVEVRIDRQLPTDARGQLLYARRADHGGALWPLLLEKAFAKAKGGYDAIGAGGNAANAVFSLTGWPVRYFPFRGRDARNGFDATRVAEAILPWLKEGDCILANTPQDTGFRGIAGHHVYSVVGSVLRPEGRFIVLRNPWGRVTKGGSRDSDGVFALSVPELGRLFRGVAVGGPTLDVERWRQALH